MANNVPHLRGPVVDLTAYRAHRAADAVSTVSLTIARDGAITAHPLQSVAAVHRLAVLTWCLGVASSLLDAYIDDASAGGLQ
ncbi:hypothetical protein [Burkholderia multivorans]|uniref:hypothetical protein n=1 Tax=Burkholderia multivorans TaxID=87883 RepID=UPI0011B1E614|nr:hypothetical protein [Burkholderia multivorans]MCO1344685.1 hypothetical protein [Burkholderia multivorans]MCO1442003.1 hypothetical protein [Burkholderia multivorans]UQO28135.1 hypothetical protein L0Z21_14420 [Burkholderia multivorans]UQO41470.1 hypothetical protein L0Z43_14950 [Burkholderia multivorans]